MDIDILNAKKEFKEYVKNYNSEDKQIKLKIRHIERVTDAAKETAKYLNLDEEDSKLAELIALLHDIGRFEQVKRYNTLIDKESVNHGELGVEILFGDGLIRKFIKTNKYDEIIRKAILNHNRPKIEDGLSQKELLHAKLIRDSDKTDIYYVLITEPIEAIYGIKDMSKQKISDKIYKEFIQNKVVIYDHMETPADQVVSHFAYVYNFYFDYIKQLLKEKKYLDTFYSRFHFEDEQTQNRLNEIYRLSKEFLENKEKVGKEG